MMVLIAIVLLLIVPGPSFAEEPAQVAIESSPDPDFEARYCAFLSANRFGDNVASYRWTKLIVGIEDGRPAAVLSEIHRDAFALMKRVDAGRAEADFAQCNARLVRLEAEAQKPRGTAASATKPPSAPPAASEVPKPPPLPPAASEVPKPPPLPPGGSYLPPPKPLVMSDDGVLREPPSTRTGEDAFECRQSKIVPVAVCYDTSFWTETTAPQEAIEAVYRSANDGIQFALATSTRVRDMGVMRDELFERLEATASGGRHGLKIAADRSITLDGHPWRYLEYSVNVGGVMRHMVNVYTSIMDAGTAQVLFSPDDIDAYRPEIDEIISRIEMRD
ncbi:MAG: hypothetical protein KC616_19815 [Myxococcales bacterium]|nr:hypothetical protein [Myxococcales bacterium]